MKRGNSLRYSPGGRSGPGHILFTGGGSAGHVTVNSALIPSFLAEGWKVSYMGSANGIEEQLIRRTEGVDYYGISTGKLRRYMDLDNIKDPFRVVKGIAQARRLIRRLKPDIVFSKGGFVSVPVVLGAWMNRVPVIIHESDLTPGLANRIAIPFASKVCVTFPETAGMLKNGKAVPIGPVIRDELRRGDARRGLDFLGFRRGKPVLLIMGGSLGSKTINGVIRRQLRELTARYQIVHLCGKGQLDPDIRQNGYRQFEYIHDELADAVACADIVVSRAGSNSIFEFLALRKPMLLIPLSRNASRGDQILNAKSFRSRGYCEVLHEEELNDETFLSSLNDVYARRADIRAAMDAEPAGGEASRLVRLIADTAGRRR